MQAYLEASKLGEANAQYALGTCYRDGRGCEQSDENAFKWFMRAAENGKASGLFDVGVSYEQGRGVEPNRELAASFYNKATHAGKEGNDYATARLAIAEREPIGNLTFFVTPPSAPRKRNALLDVYEGLRT